MLGKLPLAEYPRLQIISWEKEVTCVFFCLGWDSVSNGVWVPCEVRMWRYLLLHFPLVCPLSGPVPPCLGNIGFVVVEFCIYS